MSTQLDLDDVAGTSELAKKELATLRARVVELELMDAENSGLLEESRADADRLAKLLKKNIGDDDYVFASCAEINAVLDAHEKLQRTILADKQEPPQ